MKRLLLISALILPLSGCLINKAHAGSKHWDGITLQGDFHDKMIDTLAENEGWYDVRFSEPEPGQITIEWTRNGVVAKQNNSVVQKVEQQSPKLRVGGSIPSTVAK